MCASCRTIEAIWTPKNRKNTESSSTTCNIICSLKVWASELIMLQMPICDNQCAFSKRTDNFSMCARTHIVNEMCAAPRRSSDAIKVNAQKQPHTNESRKEQSETTTKKCTHTLHTLQLTRREQPSELCLKLNLKAMKDYNFRFMFFSCAVNEAIAIAAHTYERYRFLVTFACAHLIPANYGCRYFDTLLKSPHVAFFFFLSRKCRERKKHSIHCYIRFTKCIKLCYVIQL